MNTAPRTQELLRNLAAVAARLDHLEALVLADARRPRTPALCVICGKPLERRTRRDGRPESLAHYQARQTCSDRCRGALASRARKTRRGGGLAHPRHAAPEGRSAPHRPTGTPGPREPDLGLLTRSGAQGKPTKAQLLAVIRHELRDLAEAIYEHVAQESPP